MKQKLPTETPVYLFLGFLESGKTKFIQETLEDPRFSSSGEKTLLLVTEEGEEEYETIRFANAENVDYVLIDDKSKLTEEYLTQLQLQYGFDRVVVEYNGTWMLEDFFNAMPEGWMVNQIMTFFDSATFLNYNANMRQFTYDKIQNTQLVVFNRFDDTMDKTSFHKIVRGISRRCDIVYEHTDGKADFDDIEDPLPFDINAPVITVEDKDYAFFYRDLTENLESYIGKTVQTILIFLSFSVALQPASPTVAIAATSTRQSILLKIFIPYLPPQTAHFPKSTVASSSTEKLLKALIRRTSSSEISSSI